MTAFQTARSLPVTGVVDRTTWETLKATPAPVVPVIETTTTTVAPTTTTTTAAPAQTIVAVRGNRGGIVFELQRKLLAAGYSPGVIDGIFGSKTEAATKAFQTSKGLAANGVVDQATWDAFSTPPVVVDPSPDDVVLAYGSRGATVVDLQTRLAQAGHNPGPIDGKFGPKTRGAVLSFQQAKGLTANGLVTRATWEALTAS